MAYTRSQVVERALAADVNAPGTCYLWTRTMIDSPAVGDFDGDGDADAVDGWKAATNRHSGDHNPPAGTPVFWSGGRNGYGHAAISLGGSKIRSTDAGGSGQIATVDLGWVERTWGLTYLGWSEGLGGALIPLDPPPAPPKPKVPTRIERSRALLERALVRAQAKKNRARAAAIRAALKALPKR